MQNTLIPKNFISTDSALCAEFASPSGYTGLQSFHKYWGKKPVEPLASIIELLSPKDGVVVDPFLGGGLMSRICLQRSRRFIGIDVNPVSVELAKLFINLPNLEDYTNHLKILKSEVKPIINSSYERQNGSIGSHFLWDDANLISVWTKDSKNKRIEDTPNDTDKNLLNQYAGYSPKNFREITTFSNSRINSTAELSLLDVFKPRACANIDIIIDNILSIDDDILRRAFLLTLTASSGQMSNFVFAINRRGKTSNNYSNYSKTEVGSWSIGFWRPSRHFEINVWNCFENRAKKLLKTLQNESMRFNSNYEHSIESFMTKRAKFALLNNSVQASLPLLPENSVDLVLTDPPHGDRIPYLELSEIWNSILQFSDTDFNSEIVISNAKERGMTPKFYHENMKNFFLECSRIIKPSGFLALIYNCKNKDWSLFSELSDLHFIGRFDLNYSANSIIQDNRNGSLKSDYVFLFSPVSENFYPKFLEKLPGWSKAMP